MNLAKLSISRPIFITCLVVFSLFAGWRAMRSLNVDSFPEVNFPIIIVQTIYPGASPQDVEQLVSKPVEDELAGMAGLKRLTSQNLESVSVVLAEFRLEVDSRKAEQEVRNKLGNIRNALPKEIEEPVVRRFDPSDLPIVTLSVKSDLPDVDLYDVVKEQIKPQLERVDGVGLARIQGGRKREIHVLVDKQKLQDREISLLQVSGRIEASSKNVPLGSVQDAGGQETVMRSVGEYSDLKALEETNVNFIASDRAVLLKDIALVQEAAQKETTRATLNGERALIIDVLKQSGGNTVKVADGVRKVLGEVNASLKAAGIDAEVVIVRDGSNTIKADLADVRESIFIGIALCIVVVFFFLGSFRSTVITGLALPNSLLGAFILMAIMGFTINVTTLLALSLAVGLLIDDAIVVRENIFRYMEQGMEPKEAAEKGTAEVTLAVVATSAVVIAVFAPIAFLDGIVGQFFRQFGLTMVFAIIISTLDALTVAPMLSAYWVSKASIHGQKGRGPIGMLLAVFEKIQTLIERAYEKLLKAAIYRPIWVLGGAFVIFVSSLATVPMIPKTFIPTPDKGEFTINLELPTGSSLEKTFDLLQRVEAEVRKDSDILITSAVAGNENLEANRATFYVGLKPFKNRDRKTSEVKNATRKVLVEKFSKEAIVQVADFDEFGGGQRPIEVVVTGPDLNVLAEYSLKAKARIAQIKGITDVDTNFRLGKPEFKVEFDRLRAEELGVSTGTAGAELRARIEGIVPATYRKNGLEYDIRVKLADADRDLRQTFSKTLVPNVNFNMIALSQVAHAQETTGFSKINRMNKARLITISGDIGPGGALGDISNDITQVLNVEMPPPPGVKWEFVGQSSDFQELIENMLLAIFTAVLLIYLVLASLYESFITPFTILLALPLAICGALYALLLTQATIDLFSLIGIIMLLGVVAKNSILLVDYTVQMMNEKGMPRTEALLLACRTRLRPILMTSFALIAGMIPIAVGLNEASSQRTSMGIALIGGLISSTLLSLVVVPAAFGYIDDFRLWLGRLMSKLVK